MTAGKAFFDTNVLLYMFSASEPRKQMAAQKLFDDHNEAGQIVLSTQVVQEFYVSALRKLELSLRRVRTLAAELLKLPLVVIAPEQIVAAMDLQERYQISFWDALILAAAQSSGADVVFTEDLNDGQHYGGVLVRNPFLATSSKSRPKR